MKFSLNQLSTRGRVLLDVRKGVQIMLNRQGGGQGQGKRNRRRGAGPDGHCVCPECGHKEPHVAGQPCYQKKCPKCGTQLIRE